MKILENIATLYTCAMDGEQKDVHPIPNAALIWDNDSIVWVGKADEVPANYPINQRFDAEGRIVLPGLIDCHTHLAFGGWRADEFELRSLGAAYIDIAKAGGGILSTVKNTRKATKYELKEKARGVLAQMTALGVTTVECKSGYGLTTEDEIKVLEVYKELKTDVPNRLVSTFLGAHTIPPEFIERRDEYIDLLCKEMIPKISEAKLAEFCDIFVEISAFTIEEARRILETGKAHGLSPKIHADQLSCSSGAELAAELGAASADHLEYISDQGISDMAKKGVVAVSLPLATFYLCQPAIPARKLIEAGVPVAVSTDFNPGSAPSFHLPMAMMMACTLQKMSPAEALKGTTIYAAKAIQRDSEIGSLEAGKKADFIEIDAENVNHWLYHFRSNACERVFINGEHIHGN